MSGSGSNLQSDQETIAGSYTIAPADTYPVSLDATFSAIDFGGVGATLTIPVGVTPTATIGAIGQGNFIDAEGIANGTVTVSGKLLTLIGTNGTLSLALDTSYAGVNFRTSPDSSGGTLISYTETAQPYVVPLYHEQNAGDNTQHLIIYASLGGDGGPLVPYLFDTGSPALFSTYGTAWWNGGTAPPINSNVETLGNQTYYYNQVLTDIALGSKDGTVDAAVNNAYVGQITEAIMGTSDITTPNDWAIAVATGGAPIAVDQTYGDLGAGLMASDKSPSLATVLSQIPIGSNLDSGFIIQSGGVSATAPGSLTIGIEPNLVTQWETTPGVIVLNISTVDGTTLPNPDGNKNAAPEYHEVQVNPAQLILQNGTSSGTFQAGFILDTGNGSNNIIFNGNTSDNFSAFIQGSNAAGILAKTTTFGLSGTDTAGSIVPILNYTSENPLPSGGQILVTTSSEGLVDNTGISLFYQYNVMFDQTGGLVLLQPISCFAEGTRIETACGSTAVELLSPGDLLRTQIGGGLSPITWIGRRKIDTRRHPKPETVWPVRIAANAFDDGTPMRDLYLSPDHAVYLDGVLIPVKYLINNTTIAQVAWHSVTYYHVELPCHDVVHTEGLPTETYLDVGDHSNFEQEGRVLRLHPEFALRLWEAKGCAELVVAGPVVQLWRENLRVRAQRLQDQVGVAGSLAKRVVSYCKPREAVRCHR
jgi:hypothetical protein